MNASSMLLSRQGQYLLQIGMILIFYSSFDGFAIPFLSSPRIGLSVHTLSALQAIFLLAQGLLWPKLKLGVTASWVAFWRSLYGTFAILAAYTIAAIWGVGSETIVLMGELPHGLSHGTAFQENFIKILAYSSAPTGLTCFAIILWGLRIVEETATGKSNTSFLPNRFAAVEEAEPEPVITKSQLRPNARQALRATGPRLYIASCQPMLTALRTTKGSLSAPSRLPMDCGER